MTSFKILNINSRILQPYLNNSKFYSVNLQKIKFLAFSSISTSHFSSREGKGKEVQKRRCLIANRDQDNQYYPYSYLSLNCCLFQNRYFTIDQTLRKDDTQVELSDLTYEDIAEETLQSLTSHFDDIVESANRTDVDVTYNNGVLTVNFEDFGTYVINKQSPNKQIWLSSPESGPKRYDFINNTWIYKHDGKSLYELLNFEITSLCRLKSNFEMCSFGQAHNKAQ